jgi:hypothetical protein
MIVMQVYYPGDAISGAVTFTLTEPRHFECIKVNFLGKAHARWTMVSEYTADGRTTREPVCFSGDQAYVQESLLLWTPLQRNGGTIGPGSFRFQFRFIALSMRHLRSFTRTFLLPSAVHTFLTRWKVVRSLGNVMSIIKILSRFTSQTRSTVLVMQGG